MDALYRGVGPIHRTPGWPPFGVVCASAWGRRVFVTVVCAWGRGGAVWCGVCVGVQEGYCPAPVHPCLKQTSGWPFVVRHPPLSVGAGRPCADQSCRAEPSLLEHRQIATKRSRELLGMACLLWWHLALKVRAGVSSLYCIHMTRSNPADSDCPSQKL